ncbi:MAG: hypothetical protein NMK33_04180 [Candidatus Cardinium sp.]|uniref:hypothetical protein n=1 Tax=Cardinium endosymbiont of Dermatophagoides farinae TaxID=2597823 RepID=UPI001CB9128F|nr:hypothetical protein [Cardinium endosymbiont of Dermatophagoides farinae]UWW96628.1 MAG: hypothetical protein NMK33_04180 [Candidatus Cardinium sp.]
MSKILAYLRASTDKQDVAHQKYEILEYTRKNRPSAKPISNGNFGVEACLCCSNTSSILATALLLKTADHK